MIGKGNADAKWSENKIEGEDSVKKTVNCLRGRLLAERVASRNARQEAEQLGNKLLELENMLTKEAKSRNRAEKKLKLLMKRLQSMDKSDISTASSSRFSSSINVSENGEDLQMNISTMSENQESKQNVTASTMYSKFSLFNLSNDDSSATEGSSTSEVGSNENPLSPTGNQEDDENQDNQVDNSMALVPVDMQQENHDIDPEVLDATVKEVLDALRRAKDQLQSSMERRRMSMFIKVG